MSIVLILIHFIANLLFGSLVLKSFKVNLDGLIKYPIAFIVGSFFETLLGFCLLTINISEFVAFYITTIPALAFWLYDFFKHKAEIKVRFQIKRPIIKFLEIVLIIPILIKVCLSLFNTIRFPLYFDDAMNHWSGRARALYGHVNWSLDSASPYFMGKQFGYPEYPLHLVIWRSINAHLNGGWDDVIAKADSWIFYLLILISTYAIILELTKIKWAALAGTFMTSAIPLMWYHTFSGYSEIGIVLLFLLIAFALIKDDILIAAILTACAIWTKNEGLFIILPVFSVAICFYSFLKSKYNIKLTLINIAKYFIYSIIFISPWLIFKKLNSLAWTAPLPPENFYHEGSIEMFFDMLFLNPTSSILWLSFMFIILMSALKWIKSPESIFLLLVVLITLTLFIYVFCFTRNNIFLMNQMTIHRSFLQIAPLAIVLMTHVCFLKNTTAESTL